MDLHVGATRRGLDRENPKKNLYQCYDELVSAIEAVDEVSGQQFREAVEMPSSIWDN